MTWLSDLWARCKALYEPVTAPSPAGEYSYPLLMQADRGPPTASGNSFKAGTVAQVKAGKAHNGRDWFIGPKTGWGWPLTANATVCAIAHGRVEKVKWYANGLWIRVNHGDGVKSIYGHMNGRGLVVVGDEVYAGTPLGPVWARVSPPHLHAEIWVQGKPVEPVEHLERVGARYISG